ncbi:hypothetical protein [Flavobacterium panacagri]|uniref:hypothetical protein n=1 Tax=Flavobacterium panacagri TaxID=3034146 RepID=UPI0025A62E7B|nr:hypothetical protein [Flavobacterium panacagri]
MNQKFLLVFLIVLFSCENKTEIKDNSYDEFTSIIYKNSELVPVDGFLKNYKEIGSGNKTIYAIQHCHENVKDIADTRSCTDFYFSLKTDSLKVGEVYFFQNDDIFDTYCLQRGAAIGIVKLYGTKGKLKIIKFDKNNLKIKIEGEIVSDFLYKDQLEKVTLIKDTILDFKTK